MRKFNFNLEKILQIREFKEEECKIELGRAISVLNMIENEIKQTAQKHFNASRERFKNPQDMASWDVYILRLEQEAQTLSQQAAQAQFVVEEKRELYLEAQRDLKALEKLKEKQKKEHIKEMEKLQMNETDDITSSRWIRAESGY